MGGISQIPDRLEYFEVLKDPASPWAFITYQIHPDENMAEKAVVKTLDDLIGQNGVPTNLLFVPQSCPTGIARLRTLPANYELNKRNLNGMEHDLNWSFLDDSTDPEVIAWLTLLKDKKFKKSLHIHHDWGMFGKYYYGYIHQRAGNPQCIDWNSFMNSLSNIGFQPFADKMDDWLNPALGNQIPQNGLILTYSGDRFAGNLENWLVETNRVDQACTLELPYDIKEADSMLVLQAIYSSFFLA